LHSAIRAIAFVVHVFIAGKQVSNKLVQAAAA